ncbi:MAG TPA: phosphopantetheine-binding protein [Streptosporangiaceae bacterium]|jgi:acyl carrier protein|nr:phosphopantetheine-binding protein [Streptosporangiaceae bacterium]
MDYEKAYDEAAGRLKMCDRIRQMIVGRLDLPIEPEWISNDQPLFGRGLELDSVDTLELILGIESEFDVSLTEDDRVAFGSVSRLTERILEERPGLLRSW